MFSAPGKQEALKENQNPRKLDDVVRILKDLEASKKLGEESLKEKVAEFNARRCDFFWKAAHVYSTGLSNQLKICLRDKTLTAGEIQLHWQGERMRRVRVKLGMPPMPTRDNDNEDDLLPRV